MSQAKAPRPRIIVVLGMHRSGTSVTTNLLNAFGVALSDDLMEPTEHNLKGYFESLEISKIHDEILAVMGSDWRTTSITVPFPKDWWHLPGISPLKARLAEIATRELERHEGLWGFKDPRTARLLPVWLEIIAELNLDARYVLVSRNPIDVGKSLFSREQIDPTHAEMMWLEHNMDAVLNLAGKIDAIVEYSGWLEDPQGQAKYMIKHLGLPWAGSREDLQRITDEVISPDLQHHVTEAGSFRLPFTAPFYTALVRRDIAQLKGLAEVFNISRAFTQVVLGRELQVLRGQVGQLVGHVQAQNVRVAELEAARITPT